MTEREIRNLTDRIVNAAKNGDTDKVDDLVSHLRDMARADGKNDLLADLVDAKEISSEGVEFAIENNGCKDPRR